MLILYDDYFTGHCCRWEVAKIRHGEEFNLKPNVTKNKNKNDSERLMSGLKRFDKLKLIIVYVLTTKYQFKYSNSSHFLVSKKLWCIFRRRKHFTCIGWRITKQYARIWKYSFLYAIFSYFYLTIQFSMFHILFCE